MRSSARRTDGSNDWSPIDSRWTPAARSARRYGSSTVSGLASDVISASGRIANADRNRPISAPISFAGSVVGVPPPKKIEANSTPSHDPAASAASRPSAAV